MKLLREEGEGPALLISPLLSLMRNQIAAAERMGVRAQTIHSDNQEEWATVESAMRRDEVDILLISPPNVRLVATTATANNRVMSDLGAVLGPDFAISRGDLNRPKLLLQTIRLRTQAERLAWLAQHVPAPPGHGIIYTLTVRDAIQVADWLRSRGLHVESYSGETGERRPELEHASRSHSC